MGAGQRPQVNREGSFGTTEAGGWGVQGSRQRGGVKGAGQMGRGEGEVWPEVRQAEGRRPVRQCGVGAGVEGATLEGTDPRGCARAAWQRPVPSSQPAREGCAVRAAGAGGRGQAPRAQGQGDVCRRVGLGESASPLD